MFISFFLFFFKILGSVGKIKLVSNQRKIRNEFHLQIKYTREIIREINYQDGKNYFSFKNFCETFSHTQNEDVHKMLKVED